MPHRSLEKLPLILTILTLVIYALSLRLAGPHGWDDGAITMSFARTIVINSEFALTAISERVEGSSTILLTFIFAIAYAFSGQQFIEFITIAQVIVLTSLIGSALALNHTLVNAIPNHPQRGVIILLFVLIPMHLTEVINAMEMPLFGLLLLWFSVSYSDKSKILPLIIFLLLLVRFEAVFYLSVACATHAAMQPETRRYALLSIVWIVVIFAAITLVRWLYFGDIMPNTIWAKLNEPYTPNVPTIDMIVNKLRGAQSFLTVNSAFIFMSFFGWTFSRKIIGKKIIGDIKTWILLSFFAFSLLSGKNWGYDGRMYVAAIPLFVVLTAEIWKNIEIRNGNNLSFSVTALALALTFAINYPLYSMNYQTILTGAYHQNFSPKPLRGRHSQTIRNDRVAVTPASFRLTGIAVLEIRRYLRLDDIVFMSPDVGGLALTENSDNMRIVDIAMLTNRILAHQGYSALNEVIRAEKPDIIEVHSIWSKTSGIYNLSEFRKRYKPIVFHNTLFWIKAEYLDLLADHPNLTYTNATSIDDLLTTRYLKPGNQADILELTMALEFSSGTIPIFE